jgi:hypothetical protein
MTGQNIWHIKTRKLGEAEFQFAQTQHQPREPVDREVIKVGVGGRIIRAKIVAIHGSHSGSTGTFVISAEQIEDNGNPPGHREADEDDF